ncbi:hypothetical protein F0160_25850 [Paraburkholderia sp. JPY303]|uniref:hypothetical protein n=1 Tax=Paraburkholderia atlantica TaxID=2654982 RepID=UPI0015908521|nr:hypothetical protein [Paraburkholderia atlantica]NUY33902.1 hypothetical protein [Paraburkholderia atlantica]
MSTPVPVGPGSSPTAQGQHRLALDNLIRRELRVGDPNDPMQIAGALLDRYKADPRAAAIGQEARGLPFLQTAAVAAPVAARPTSSTAEWQQALNDVENDLRELTSDAILKDVSPELRGWAQTIRSALREGYAAASLALDPRNRDKAFGIRRQLNDYARVARLVGSLTASMTQNYRKLAQSLDEAAAVLLVVMGEALSNIGIGGGRYLLQAPYTELQVRRDAAIYALRNLVGATQQAYGPSDWPRGLDAYRTLYQQLEQQGYGDLRSLLEEGELSRTMDELVQRAADGNVDGLRALGSTAQIDLARVRRFVSVAHLLAQPESPPLAAFLESLMLFSEAFDPSGGIRLLRIARPPILLYGLYGMQSLQHADQRLLLLIQKRGLLAGLLDCFTSCDCSDSKALCQIVLDKVLYGVDRAIDLYAVGKDEFGAPEFRASAYSFIIDSALLQCCDFNIKANTCNVALTFDGDENTSHAVDPVTQQTPKNAYDANAVQDSIQWTLFDIRGLLRPVPGDSSANVWDPRALGQYLKPGQREQLHQELCIQRDAEMHLKSLVDTLAPGCIPDAVLGGLLRRLMHRALNMSRFNLYVSKIDGSSNAVYLSCADGSGVGNLIANWNKTHNPHPQISTVRELIDADETCDAVTITIPPHYETSLDTIARDVKANGKGR